MAKVKVLLSLDESDRAYIDEAAEAAGETRSEFMARAAEMRIEGSSRLTPEQQRALTGLLRAFDPSGWYELDEPGHQCSGVAVVCRRCRYRYESDSMAGLPVRCSECL